MEDPNPTTYLVSVEVRVTDPARLVLHAKQRVDECWGDHLTSLVSGGEGLVERALLEVLAYSNCNPSPDEFGIDYTGDSKVTAVRR